MPEHPSLDRRGATSATADAHAGVRRRLHALLDTPLHSPMSFPNGYVWLVFFSSLDIMLTHKILERDGTEVNPIARAVIDAWGLPGAIVFKFSMMLFFIMSCEYIARRGRPAAWLIRFGVIISAMPVFYSIGLLSWHTFAIGVE